MDRPLPSAANAAVVLETAEVESAGWDPHAVWRERVQDAPRRPVRTARLAPNSAGWDPLETWRLRVRSPR
ncbi:MAG: hypothetical protein JSR54_20395 [Proteobacteria bacterium]|nr:hypothetical protein [Pseudomonadota bacterium]